MTMIVRDTICMQHAIVCHMMCITSEINNNAHSPRTCWRPRCLARGLCHMNTTCLPVKSTRQHVRSTHPVRQPLERRHRSPCTLQHDPRVVGLCRAWRAAACRHDGPQSRGQQQAYCKDIMAYNGILTRRRHTVSGVGAHSPRGDSFPCGRPFGPRWSRPGVLSSRWV
jgi:hypothetical protein